MSRSEIAQKEISIRSPGFGLNAYIHTHRGKTFVVGLAGEAIAAGKLQHIAQDLALIPSMGVKIVLVHGFRPQVNEQLAAKGHEAKYSHGMRITDEVALDSAQEAAGQLRYEIEAAFSQGLPNTPMAGATVRVISGNFITARPVGIMDPGVDVEQLLALLLEPLALRVQQSRGHPTFTLRAE